MHFKRYELSVADVKYLQKPQIYILLTSSTSFPAACAVAKKSPDHLFSHDYSYLLHNTKVVS
jgi:hypothetical protein